MPKYFTKKEVALHNKTEDAWLIVSGKIYNLSSVISKYGPDAEELKPLLMFAGKDVSHWFEKDTDNVKHFPPPISEKSSSKYVNYSQFVNYVDIDSGKKMPFSLHGIPPHVLDAPKIRWWNDEKLLVGEITRKSRLVKIINAIIGNSTILEVGVFTK
jgi:hypothetical protein